jgi:homocysteine S-methyltransferase
VSDGQATVVLLDGALGTQLAARGFELLAPHFSARALVEAPELLATIHADYLRAGAQVLTTNSFGLHASTLARAGIADQQAALARRSVEVLTAVRQLVSANQRGLARFRVAGSVPPRPLADASSDRHTLARAEYRRYAECLATAGADLILLETFTSVAEAELAVAGVAEIGLPIWLSIVAGAPVEGQRRADGTRLIAGDPIRAIAGLVDRVDAMLINCTRLDAVPAALDAVLAVTRERPDLPLGLLPHLGYPTIDGGWVDRIVEPDVFADQVRAWLRPERSRFELIGACCGSGPADIAELRARLQPDEAARERAWTRLAELVP